MAIDGGVRRLRGGFPLTIYLLTAWLGRFPVAAPFAHASGNLWGSLLLRGWGGGLFMTFGGLVILLGMIVMGQGWRAIHAEQGALVCGGIYGRVRHPQYAGIGLVILGALIQWPTLLTLLMAPVLLASYVHLARREERELEARFGEDYRTYRQQVPGFIPSWKPFHRRGRIPTPVSAESRT